MKYTPSIAFDEFAGSAKGVTAAKSRGRKYIRNKGTYFQHCCSGKNPCPGKAT